MTELFSPEFFHIDSVAVPGTGGRIGMCGCPGKNSLGLSGSGGRGLDADLREIRDWGASLLLSLIEPQEYEEAGIADIAAKIPGGMEHIRLPIRDMGRPDAAWEAAWEEKGSIIRAILNDGGKICVHCMGGLGRTGLVAARILTEFGMEPDAAIRAVRRARPGAIQTEEQEAYIRALSSKTGQDSNSKYFSLSLDSLRALSAWAADCADRALYVFEAYSGQDLRPRQAIDAARAFAAGGRRTAELRRLSLAAYAAANESRDDAAAASANAACLAASSAYTHPLRDVHQTKHILGPAAYAALALELRGSGDKAIGDGEIRRSLERVPPEVREILAQMPRRDRGKSRIDELMHILDMGIRS